VALPRDPASTASGLPRPTVSITGLPDLGLPAVPILPDLPGLIELPGLLGQAVVDEIVIRYGDESVARRR